MKVRTKEQTKGVRPIIFLFLGLTGLVILFVIFTNDRLTRNRAIFGSYTSLQNFLDRSKSTVDQRGQNVRTSTVARSGQSSLKPRAERSGKAAVHQTRAEESPEGVSQRYLIFLCDKGRSCGGWGDRQRGLVSAFLLAYLTGRRFGVNMTTPCDLNLFYQPNKVAWNVTAREIQHKSFRYIDSMNGRGTLHGELLKEDFDKLYPEDVIFLRTNVEHFWSLRGNPHYKMPEWARHGKPPFFGTAWKMIMKPTPHLESHLKDFLRSCRYYNRTKPFVCAHVRIGVSEYNPKDTRQTNDVNKLGALWDFLQGYVSNGSDVFIATDHPGVRNMSRKRFGSAHHDTGGVITHVDKTRGNVDQQRACEGFEYALLDQLVLTHCDVMVMSLSGFSLRAAYIREDTENLFRFAKGNVTRVSRL